MSATRARRAGRPARGQREPAGRRAPPAIPPPARRGRAAAGAMGTAGTAGGPAGTGGRAGAGGAPSTAKVTWSANVRLNDDTGTGNQSEVTMAAGPGGLVIAGWMDERAARVCAFSFS